MKKTLGKALSLFLCVIMLATMAIGSVTSYAYHTVYDDEYEYKIGNSTIYYRIIDNEITISGCEDDSYGELVIPEKINNIPVKYIGDSAFEYCNGLTSVSLPDSVTNIGIYAFSGCNGLTSVTIPDSVTSLGNYALAYCIKLTSVTIPNSVTSIGNMAFAHCTGLTSVTVPDSVLYIGADAFYLVNNVVYFGEAVGSPWGAKAHNGYVENGLVYNDKSKTEFLGCPSTKKGDVVLPESVTSIGDNAFYYCAELTSITIPNSVTSIGNEALSGCSGLTSITIPDSVTWFGSYAFSGCSGLTSFSIPKSVSYVGNEAFVECSKLVSIDVSPQNEHYCSDNSILFDIDKTTLIKYPDAKKGYSYSIPDSVHNIDASAFSYNMNINEIVISDNVEIIGWKAFSNCQNLKKFKLGNKIKSIGYYAFTNTAFYNNYSNWSSDGLLYLKEYLLASKNSTLEEYKPCDSSIKIKDGTILIAGGAFLDNHSIVEVYMPDSLIYIGEYAFAGCKNLKYINFGSGLGKIGYSAFGNCPNIQKFEIGANDRFYTDNSGALLEKSQYSEYNWEYSEYPGTAKRLIAYPNGSPETSYTVAKDVTSIDGSAFVGCSNLKQILVKNGNKNFASHNGALYELYENDSYSENGESFCAYLAYLIQIPAVGNRYAIPEKIAANGVDYKTIEVNINAPFQSNPTNPTILDVPKSISYISSYNSSDYICFEGTEDEWKNGAGHSYDGDSKILFEAYGKDIEDLIVKDPDILPEEHTITITENYTSACGIVAETSNRTFNEPVHIAVNEAFTSAEQTAIKAIADGKDAVAYNIAIVNEAGGAITNLNGNKVTLKIPESMISSNGSIDTLKIYHITSTDPVLGVQKEVFSTNPTSDIEKPIFVEVIDGTRYFCFDVTSWSPFVFEYTQTDEPFIPGESNIISIDLDAETLNLNYKSTATLNPIVVGTGDVEYDIKFESSNPKVVSVDENGKVTALKKGSADITVTVTDEYGNSLSDTCKVNVTYTWWQWIIKIVLFGWIWY